MGSPAPAEARSFGKYTLVARLATGGMAEIFLARLSGAAGFEKLVCIKRILPHLARDKQFVSMFLDEARIAARISHPNVCQVFELGELAGSYYIAMEYLEGVPLACFRRRDYYGAPPDPRLVAGIALQACEGLHHAHQLKADDGSGMELVHRDVSPQNLFVTVDGVVKVLDFGIAKIQDASMKTTTGAVKGTYAYMAPEQLRGELVDRRTDVWAMGIVMWETLTRRHLFKRETDFLTFQAISTEGIPDVCEIRPDVPPALSKVIMQALSRDREHRQPTARALGEAVSQAVQSIGGPLAPSAVSDEIGTTFAVQLREQGALIKIARDGGGLDLEDDRGPMVGHGSELLTTPVSNQLTPPATSVSMFVEYERPGTPTIPTPRQRSRIWVIALSAVVVVGAVFAVYWLVRTPKTPAAALASATPHDAAAPDAAHIVEYVARPDVPVDARVPTVAVDAEVAAAPVDAAVVATHPDTRPPVRPPTPPTPVVQKPTGPPGFITIDSSPVYAVIFIDGKRYGETPLVKISLAPGKHSVRAVSPSGATRNVSVSIESGKVAPARRIEW